VADRSNGSIRRVSPTGRVTTVAGVAGSFNHGGYADGPADEACFRAPMGVAVDARDHVFIADEWNHAIRVLTPDGRVYTLAGRGGTSGAADGRGVAAHFNQPTGLLVTGDGKVIIADRENHAIRVIEGDGEVRTIAGRAGDPDGVDGSVVSARFKYPQNIALGDDGVLLIADTLNHAIRRLSPEGTVTTIAGKLGRRGLDDGPPGSASFSSPTDVSFGSEGRLYVADWSGHAIRVMTSDGSVSTYAGPRASGESSLQGVAGLADRNGQLIVAQRGRHVVVMLGADGRISAVVGEPGAAGSSDGRGQQARFKRPRDVAVDRSANVWVADTGNCTVRRIDPDGDVVTVAGLAGECVSRDGVGRDARFAGPTALAAAPNDWIYVADTGGHTVRVIDPEGRVTTLAGRADEPGSADGVAGIARFRSPSGIAVDSALDVFVADTGNGTIRRVTPAGEVTTLAGSPTDRAVVDGSRLDARFGSPNALALDASGVLFVVDGRRFVRRLSRNGIVTTVAGASDRSAARDGTGDAARFWFADGIAIDRRGRLYVAESRGAISVGRRALSDRATLDRVTGCAGDARLLSARPATAKGFAWSVTRRPAPSLAMLGAPMSHASPFTPDVPGLYRFRLLASGRERSSITSVELEVELCTPPQSR